jgi:hypothetical protein
MAALALWLALLATSLRSIGAGFVVETGLLQLQQPRVNFSMGVANFGNPIYGGQLRCAASPGLVLCTQLTAPPTPLRLRATQGRADLQARRKVGLRALPGACARAGAWQLIDVTTHHRLMHLFSHAS